MTEVFLLSPNKAYKTLEAIQKKLIEEGLHCQILDSPKNAINKVRQCFNLKRKSIKADIQKFGEIAIDNENYVASLSGEKLNLRKKEFQLLQYFIMNQGRVVSRITILENVWGPRCNPFTNTVDVHIAALRKRINKNGHKYLKTIHGVGYRFVL